MRVALPLGPERTVRTATRAWAYRLGTLDVKWQCESHCHSALSVQSRAGGTATRARAYRLGTFTTEWQCRRRYPVRSTSSGSAYIRQLALSPGTAY